MKQLKHQLSFFPSHRFWIHD